ncbi:MAG: MarR family transcriptional regulator [Thermoleophilia bacterium]|nr:MarR family transcriptional regulator [Thermoleophilia bacterium]
MSELSNATPAIADKAGSCDRANQSAMSEIPKSIWQLTEDVLELLRSRSSAAVHRERRSDLLWLDDLTETQGNTVIAIRQLCEHSPEGITLKKLAETMGVTPAAASVMVDLLVKKKMLRRTKSKNDRRAVLIRLTPDTEGLFEISERSLLHTFMNLEESVGPEFLLDWQRTLRTAAAALRQTVGAKSPEEAGAEESTSEEPT